MEPKLLFFSTSPSCTCALTACCGGWWVQGLQGVASGAIASDYQRLRVEAVCARVGLTSLAFLWRLPQAPLLRAMIDSGVEAIIVKVAAMGKGLAHL